MVDETLKPTAMLPIALVEDVPMDVKVDADRKLREMTEDAPAMFMLPPVPVPPVVDSVHAPPRLTVANVTVWSTMFPNSDDVVLVVKPSVADVPKSMSTGVARAVPAELTTYTLESPVDVRVGLAPVMVRPCDCTKMFWPVAVNFAAVPKLITMLVFAFAAAVV